ncbi:MAG: hypothetical protein IPG72_15295 [Ardenticatenales bacterium]|jgi:hypothetical protein|nr:hypothetical protein [Ardenticatenales bacterium]
MSCPLPRRRQRAASAAGTVLALALTLTPAACTPAALTTSQPSPDGAVATPPNTATLAATALAPTTAPTETTADRPTLPAPPEIPAGAAPPTLAEIGITSAAAETFDAVATLGVSSPSGDPLWVAYTTGLRSFDAGAETPHTVAILAREGDAWRVLDRMELGGDVSKADAAATPDVDAYYGPDYMGEGGVAQVQIEPNRLWLTVDGGIGAHSGSFAVLSFDGEHLELEAHASNSFPGVGHVEDLDDDGIGELVIDQTDAYVFCYACGVREASVGVLKWDGDRLQPIVLQPVADDDNADDARYALDAVAGGFWETAAALARSALQSQPAPPGAPVTASNANWDILRNNSIVVDANFEARAALTRSGNPYPVLHHVFLGDWPGAVDALRALTPELLFAPDSPLVVGTPAEGNVPALAERIGIAAGSALNYGPKLAGAPTDFQWDAAPIHFLRGWSTWLAAPGSAAARADIARAAALAPDDDLFTASAAWIAAQP